MGFYTRWWWWWWCDGFLVEDSAKGGFEGLMVLLILLTYCFVVSMFVIVIG